MNIIGKKHIFLIFSGLLVAASVICLVWFGLKPGIDFSGGTLWQIQSVNLDIQKIQEVLPASVVSPVETGSYSIRMQTISEAEHQALLAKLNQAAGAVSPKAGERISNGVEELRFETIGPAIGQELKNKAVWAFMFVLLGISLYIAFAFRKVSQPVSSWKYGVITLITLFHDAIIPAGLMALLGKLTNVEIDTNFIVAILVVMGFSVHDTIVVFDRIRENLRLAGGKIDDFSNLVNKSINETLARSVNTSLTLILALLAMLFLGAPTLFYFILVILIGVVFGTYSSIFIASPLLTLIK